MSAAPVSASVPHSRSSSPSSARTAACAPCADRCSACPKPGSRRRGVERACFSKAGSGRRTARCADLVLSSSHKRAGLRCHSKRPVAHCAEHAHAHVKRGDSQHSGRCESEHSTHRIEMNRPLRRHKAVCRILTKTRARMIWRRRRRSEVKPREAPPAHVASLGAGLDRSRLGARIIPLL